MTLIRWTLAPLTAALLSHCSAPPDPAPAAPARASAPPPTAEQGPPHHDSSHHALEAQEHEISQELAAPINDPRIRHHRHHRFERADEWIEKFDDPARDVWQRPDVVLAALALKPDARVADVGAGTGYFAVRLARAVPQGHVYAVDLEPDMVRYLGERAARERLGNLTPVLAEAADPHVPGDVDAVLLVDTYHHIVDPTRAFARLRDSLRPGGVLAIVDFKKDAPDDAPGPPPALRIADDIVVAHLRKLGLIHVRTDTTSLPYQYIVLMARP